MASFRAKKALTKMLENGGVVSSAMLEAGYSENYAKNPHKLTNTTAFQKLLEKELPDALLARVHKEGLAAFKYESQLTGKGESEIVEVPDFAVRHRYLETGYKVKDKMPKSDEGNGGAKVLIINIAGESSQRYAPKSSPSSNRH